MVAIVVLAFLLGLGIGSFANVVIYRVPRGESIVAPRSACPRCGHPIRSRHNIPVVSWLALRGRCADCGNPISARYPIVELAMGVAFAGIVAVTGLSWTTLLLLVLAVFSIILSAIDFDVQRLPNVLVLTFAVAAGVVIVAATITEDDWVQLVRALVGAGSLGLFYVIAFVIYPRGLGFGDVKLSPVLGGVLAYFGWHQLVVGAFAGFLWGALVGIGAMVVTRKVRRVRIPFGPWMFLGTWTGIIVGAMVGDWYLHHVLSF